MATDNWPIIKAERQALADDLGALTEDEWGSASLCPGWTVRDALAHMTASARISPASFFPKLIGAGFSLGKMQTKDIAVERGSSGADALERFRSVIGSTKHPPGPPDTWLGETLVHAEDIRRPLGLTRSYPPDAAARAADFYKGSNLLIGSKKRIEGLKLVATDTTWTHGQGPEVTGPIVSLLLAMTGRKAALDDLSGDGVATLRAR